MAWFDKSIQITFMFCSVCIFIIWPNKKINWAIELALYSYIIDTENKLLVGGFPYLSPPPPPPSGCALSLLSSSKSSDHPWLSPADLSARCSAALRELIAENRATAMAKQIILERDWHYSYHHHRDDDDEDDDNHNEDIQLQSSYNLSQQHHQMFP